jgi:hypothetical protein
VVTPDLAPSARILFQIAMTDFVWNWPIVFFCLLLVACLWLMAAVLRKAKFRPNPFIVAIWSLWMLWIGLSPIWFRLNTALDGEVISAHDIPPTRGPRYATKYTLRGPDGRAFEYIAGATSDSLPRSLPVGTHLKKPKWTLYYDMDGRRFDEGGPWFGALIACFASGCLVWSVLATFRAKKAG